MKRKFKLKNKIGSLKKKKFSFEFKEYFIQEIL